MLPSTSFSFFFFFNDTATTEIYTLSLHDALPISSMRCDATSWVAAGSRLPLSTRSEEHTSELQSRRDLVCRLLLEKKKQQLRTVLGDQEEKKKSKRHDSNQRA